MRAPKSQYLDCSRRATLASAALIFLAALAFVPVAFADQTWVNPGAGSWFVSGNWSSAVPTATDFVFIENNGTAQILVPGAVAQGMDLGGIASGTVQISAGGTLNTTSTSQLGLGGQTGMVTVSGSGSTWNLNGGQISLGSGTASTGELVILNGGGVTDAAAGLSGNPGAVGLATVSGAGSTWTNNGLVSVGAVYQGTINVLAGGKLSSVGSYIGGDLAHGSPQSTGAVTVDGTNSIWTNTGDLDVGQAGIGTLTISRGGAVSNVNGFIGNANTSNGTVTVDGLSGGATWTNSGDLTIGSTGTGALIIRNGGTVSDVIGSVGGNANSSGAVTVDGAGGASTWTNTSNLFVGDGGTGVLNIINGGQVTGVEGILGNAIGSQGTVNVSGSGMAGASTWKSTGELDISAGGGAGILNISAGGQVSATGAVFIGEAASPTNGSVTVDGTGSSFTASTSLAVGFGGTGTLKITKGASVSSPIVNAGVAVGSSGTITVDGSGSSLAATSSSSMTVGLDGTGVLNLTNGGAVKVDNGGLTGTLILGFTSGSSSGTLNIGNGGAPGILNASLVQGGNGTTGGTAIINFDHNSSGYYFTTNGTSTGTPIQITGPTSVNQNGAGTTILTGNYSYTGPTTVNEGTLLIGLTSALSASSTVTVNSGGAFGGTGVAFGPVTIANGGILSPGINGPGTITVGSLTLNGASQLNYDLGTPGVVGASVNDLTTDSAALTLSGVLNVNGLTTFGPGAYRLINYTGALTNDGLSLGTLPGGYSYSIQAGAGEVNLVVTSLATNGFWNGTHTTPNGVVNGGTAVWDNTTTNWTNAAGAVSGPWTGGGAIFSGSAGTVTLGANIAFTGLEFVTDGYLLTGDAGNVFSLMPTGTATITTDGAATATIAAPFSGIGGLRKQGPGTLNIIGTSNFTGDFSMDGGTVNLQNGGTVNSAHGFVGLDSGSNATVNVKAGSAWNMTSDLYVGYSGSGTLNVTNGGAVNSNNALFGYFAGSNGIVNVDGPGSVLTTFLQTDIGVNGTATLNITNGGNVLTSHNNTLSGGGAQIGAGSVVTVDGAGSLWTVGDQSTFAPVIKVVPNVFNLYVAGTLNVQNGGSVPVNGELEIDAATVNVTGAGSMLSATRLGVGINVPGGVLNVLNGANVFSGVGYVGELAGAGGTITVDGVGSTWETDEIAGVARGTLNIQNGGKVAIVQNLVPYVPLGGPVAGQGGTLNIGDGGAPGILSGGGVDGGTNGPNTLNFNHSASNYYFTSDGTSSGTPDVIQGNVDVNLIGAGSTTLLGVNTYTGATTVNAGTLRVDGSVTATSGVSVNSGATLGGSGTINAPVTIADGATLSPGDAPGTLTVGPLTLNSGSVLNYEFGTPNVVGGGVNDLTMVNGALTLAGTLNITALPGFGLGTYRMFNYTGALTNNGLNIGSSPPVGYVFAVDTSTAKEVNLDVTSNGQTIFWNDSHISPTGAVNGGTGTWDNSTTNWTDAAGVTSGSWGSTTGVFAGAAGTVTLGASVSFTDLEFQTTGYLVNPDAGHTFSLLPTGSALINTAPGVTTTINAPFTGAGSLTKGGAGILTLTGASTITGDLTVNAGALKITSGGTFTNSAGFGYIGFDAGSNGAVIVDGSGSQWTVHNALYVGAAGTGALTIQNAGAVTVSTGPLYLGFDAGSNGTVTVDGTGGQPPTPPNLSYGASSYIGYSGTGALAIENGGTVSGVAGSWIGFNAGSVGTVTVDGAGSSWTETSAVNVGSSGTGTLSITNGASVKNAASIIGFNAGASGMATVDGAGSTWNLQSNSLYVGDSGAGVLNITNAGAVTNVNGLNIAFASGSSGTVTVSDAGSSLSNSGSMTVGNVGTGALNVLNGGTMTSADTQIGITGPASGTVTVDGANSIWNTTGNISAGINTGSTGVVNIQNGGAISVNGGAGTMNLAVNAGSSGTLNIGDGGASGALNAAAVNGGAGMAIVNFNHTDPAYTFTPNITGSAIVNFLGTGTTILTGASTYTGPTTINAGTVRVNGSLGNTAVAVNSGATLGGSGTITGPVTIAGGGTLAPGNSPGTLTVGTLTLNSRSNLNYELATPGVVGSGVNDLTIVNGNLTLGGATLNITALPGFGAGTYRIFDYTGNLIGNALSIGASPLGFTLTVNTAINNQVNLNVTAGGPLPIAYWNGPIGSPNGLINGGAGIWNNAMTNWTDSTGKLFGIWGSAVGIFAGSPGTVTLGANINFTSLEFATTGYIINGTGFSLVTTGLATITTDTGVTATINAIISGPGGLTKSGPGTLTLTGNNFYTGGTAINGGVLAIFSDSNLGAAGSPLSFNGGTLQTLAAIATNRGITLNAGGGAIDTNGFDSTLNGIISGPGGLTKIGMGALSLEAQNTYTGPTWVVNGSLYIDGAVAGDVQVFSPAVLGGHGFIGGSLTNGGTVSPGNSPGTLTVGGNYVQSSSGTLRIEIAGLGSTQHDLLRVNGQAVLDGTLQIVPLNHFTLQRGDSLTLLSAGQGIIGRFATIIDPFTSDTILQPGVVYGPTTVELALLQSSFARLAGLTPNELSVAKELDRVAFDPRANALIAYLDGRALNKLPHDFDSIAPEELTAMEQISISLATVQSVNIERRMDAIRTGSSGFSAAGFAMSGGDPDHTGSYEVSGPSGPDGKEGKAIFNPAPDNRWGFFVTGAGEFVEIDNHDFNARGYNIDTGGFTLGVDYKVTPHFAVGFSAGYAGTSADLAGGGRIFVNGGKVGLYATCFEGGFYADAAVNGGCNSYDTRRSALQGDARSSADGDELNALFATGYDWKKGGLSLGPTATFNYTDVGVGGFEERSSLAPLDIASQRGESLRSALGMKASYDWKVGSASIRPEIRAAWQHEFGDRSFAIDSHFAGGAGDFFSVEGPRLGRDSLLLGAGFAVQWNERVSTYVYYDSELGRTNYSSQNVTGGVSVIF